MIQVPISDLLKIGAIYSATGRWPKAAAAYSRAIDALPNAAADLGAGPDDFTLLRDIRRMNHSDEGACGL